MLSKPSSILRFKFRDFDSLPSGDDVESDSMTDSSGRAWRLELQLETVDDDGNTINDGEPMYGLYLKNKGSDCATVGYTFILRDADGKVHKDRTFTNAISAGECFGWTRCIERSELLDAESNILVDGTLIIDVHIQIQPVVHVPSNQFGRNLLKLLDDKDEADVAFKVGRNVIRAHRLILKMNAPVLFDFCEGSKGSHVPIKDTAPDIFRILLRYVYGGDVSDSVTNDNGEDVITAANRFGVTGLKLVAESTLVEGFLVDKDNVAHWLLFAESMTCPLLKEHAVSYFVDRAADLVNSEQWDELKESPELMRELMKEMSSTLNNDSCFGKERIMSVNDLRKELDGKGLDADGSKNMLVSRLRESNKRQRTDSGT